MDWLEEELKRALARTDPPWLKPTQARKPVPLRRWLAVAAGVAVMAGSAAAWREYRGAIAKRQVMLAVRITASKLNRIQARVREVRP